VTTAWDLANAAAAACGVELRPLTRVEDAGPINEVIGATWGTQTLNPEMVRALAHSGNVPWGAFVEGRVVGFVLGWAGVDRDGLHVHSHMLAALPDRRHSGVGYALKLAQRAQALDQGIHVVTWTFDPMVARNAWFNLGKLGTVADRFERAFYGEMADDINLGDRTDRLTARWYLDREPGPWHVTGKPVLVEVPREYHELRKAHPREAAEARDRAAEAIEAAFASGKLAASFDRERSAYVFANPEEIA
jgi:predicted GNAT superfamily acetyltransferase